MKFRAALVFALVLFAWPAAANAQITSCAQQCLGHYGGFGVIGILQCGAASAQCSCGTCTVPGQVCAPSTTPGPLGDNEGPPCAAGVSLCCQVASTVHLCTTDASCGAGMICATSNCPGGVASCCTAAPPQSTTCAPACTNGQVCVTDGCPDDGPCCVSVVVPAVPHSLDASFGATLGVAGVVLTRWRRRRLGREPGPHAGRR